MKLASEIISVVVEVAKMDLTPTIEISIMPSSLGNGGGLGKIHEGESKTVNQAAEIRHSQ